MRSKSPDLHVPLLSPSSPTRSNSTYLSHSSGEISSELSKVKPKLELLVQVIDKSEPVGAIYTHFDALLTSSNQ
jgi:hypothetical protein